MADYILPSVIAADTTDAEAGLASKIFDASTLGVVAAGVSGISSLANTVLDWTGQEKIDVYNAVEATGMSGIGDYYQRNKDAVDLAGFIGTSVIPGSLGVGALRMAQGGEALGAFGRYLGLASTNRVKAMDAAVKAIGRSGGTISSEVRAAKLAQLGWATADNILTAAAAETAVALLMKESPLFDGWTGKDFAFNIVQGALLGGTVGGVLGHFEARGILKNAQKTVQESKRDFDLITNPKKMGMSTSSEALIHMENILAMPDDFFSTTFKYKLEGKPQTTVLDTAEAFKSAKNRAEKVALDKFALSMNELAGGAESTGQAFHNFLLQKVKVTREAGGSMDELADDIRGYLQGVSRLSPLELDGVSAIPHKQFFVNEKPTGLFDMFSEVKGGKLGTTGKQAYYLAEGDPSKIKMATTRMGYETVQEAFDDGYDAMIGVSGKVSINPKSKTILRTPDEAMNTKFHLDLETGRLSRDVVVTAADVLRRADDLSRQADAIYLRGKKFVQAASVPTTLESSALEASARYLWAKDLHRSPSFFKNGAAWNDFAVLEAAAKVNQHDLLRMDFKITMPDGSVRGMEDIMSLPRFINELKLGWLQKELGKDMKGYDLRHLQARLNVSRAWLEEAASNGFQSTRELLNQFRSMDEMLKPMTVEMDWAKDLKQVGQEIAGPAPQGANFESTVMLAHHYELRSRQLLAENAVGAALEEDAKLLMEIPDVMAKLATEGGAGAGLLTASNASYGEKLKLFAQETGRTVNSILGRRKDAAMTAMAPHINAIRTDVNAAAELGVLTTALRRDARSYRFVDDMVDDGNGGLVPGKRLVDSAAADLFEKGSDEIADLDDAIELIRMERHGDEYVHGEYEVKSPKVREFLLAHVAMNAERQEKLTPLLNAAGIARKLNTKNVYIPPVNTEKYKHFAFVTSKVKVGNNTDVSMITARSEEQLRQLADKVGEDFEIVYKSDIKRFKEAQGIYDYSASIHESRVNSEVKRMGRLGDFFPETRAENVLTDYAEFHVRGEENLVRTSVQTKYRRLFSDLENLRDEYAEANVSTFAGNLFNRNTENPFQDYIRTTLDISKQSEYPLLSSLNEFVDKVGTSVYTAADKAYNAFRQSEGKDLASLETANKLMRDAGLNQPFDSMDSYLLANEKIPRNLVKMAVLKGNMALANLTLRLDFLNPLVNIISTPIMLGTEVASIRKLVAGNSELTGALNELMTVKIPGRAEGVPSTTKLIGSAIKNYFGKDKDALIARYKANGDIKEIATLHHEVMDNLSYVPGQDPGKWMAKINAAVDKGSKITGNDFAEEFTRFIAADVMRQMTEPLVVAGKMTAKEQDAYMGVFVNRVQGNYVSSQRPVLFQGTTGAAIGLFQTYAFNVMQQLTRHMEDRNAKAILTFGALQSSVYGLNGLPFFDAVNQHIIGNASGNSGHQDAYSFLPAANKEIGDWMLYGTASAFPLFGDKMPAVYSRGDMNPRHPTIVPISPMDVPAVSAGIKLVDTIIGFGKNVTGGADISSSLLFALEHQGVNRPLAGFAQALGGRSTTSKGGLVSAASELEGVTDLAGIYERMITFGGASRILGAKPMDEAIALNNLYRNQAYKAKDQAKLASLGQRVKLSLMDGQVPDTEEVHQLMLDYAKSGGRIENFSATMQHWMKDSQSSVVNQMAAKFSDPYGRKLQSIMGGVNLRDYQTIASEDPAADAAQE